jgi:phosphoribosylanthranilate isomerase
MVRVKVCGITRAQDAQAAVEAGVHALGFVFYPPSPRAVSPDVAARIMAAVPPFVTTVALFVNPDPAWVNEVISRTNPDLLQFHGDEDEAFCSGFGKHWIKAIRMRPDLVLDKEIRKFSSARGILLDTYHPAQYGGTGHAFDWSRVEQGLGKPLILAGGLTPDNVADAVRATRPWAVDVSGGVELEKGVKDPTLIEAFIRGVERGQQS